MLAFLSGSPSVGLSDFQPILDSLTGAFKVSTVVPVIAGVLTIGIGFVFMWWGARKGIGMIMAAVRKGKVSV